MQKVQEAPVAVIGVGVGGFAAVQALLEKGVEVIAVEEYPWIGGQFTSQALCVLDEYHDPVGEGIGYSRRYGAFRQALRNHYLNGFNLSAIGRGQLYFNAGNSMNSHMVAEPHVAHGILTDLLEPYLASGQLRLFTGWTAHSARCRDGRIESVLCRHRTDPGQTLDIRAGFYLDGTEAGDLFPLLGIPFRLGADGPVFGERHAEASPDPGAIQSSTVCFAVEYVPGGDFTIDRPEDYEHWEAVNGPFRLEAPGGSPEFPCRMFARASRPDGRMVPPAFYYRCVIDCRNFNDPRRPYSRSIINTGCNDYWSRPIVGEGVDRDEVYAEAKRLSRAYLYWLQTGAPRDDGGHGYPELRPCPELTGTEDGFAMAPYIREGRRLGAVRTIVEEDIAVHSQPGARAEAFGDAVGLGGFVIDIHRRTSPRRLFQGGVHSRPYQVPLSAMVTESLGNFAVAGKCIGTTQITNGAYRLHNIEWAIGEAAGELAALCMREGLAHPCLEGERLFAYQRALIREGVPLFWYEDVGYDSPGFEAIQLLSVRGLWRPAQGHLRFDGHHSVARSLPMVEAAFAQLRRRGVDTAPVEQMVLTSHGTRKVDALHRIMHLLDQVGWPDEPDEPQAWRDYADEECGAIPLPLE